MNTNRMTTRYVDSSGLLTLSMVLIVSGACNKPPVISEIKADRMSFDPGSESRFTCVASDPDEDGLTYIWAASGGTLSGEGAVVTWRAPEKLGAHKIAVTVRDGKGGEAVVEKKIKIGENHAPIIHSLISEYEAIERSTTGKLKCAAEDPDGDGLTYTWTANRGAISGSGPNANWVAPNTYVNAIITVTVEDEWGRRTSKKLIQPVVCCDSARKNPAWE